MRDACLIGAGANLAIGIFDVYSGQWTLSVLAAVTSIVFSLAAGELRRAVK